MEAPDASNQASSSKSQTEDPPPPDDKGSEDVASKKTTVRKRTKTGCLTCRKRRIKCDEGRPTCNNCIKSKRQCEGYNQRVIFKDPLGTFAPFGHMAYQTSSPQALVREQQLSVAQQKSTSQSLQIIAPKPSTLGYHPHTVSQFGNGPPVQPDLLASPLLLQDPSWYGAQPLPGPSTFEPFSAEATGASTQDQWRQGPGPELHPDFNHPLPSSRSHLYPIPSRVMPPPGMTRLDTAFVDGRSLEKTPANPNMWSHPSPEVDDDLLDESDYEHDMQSLLEQGSRADLDGLGLIVSQKLNDRFDAFGSQPRTFAVHNIDHVLDTYVPSPADSPLNDQAVASVFWHFVNVTGPSISLYEKHPSEPSAYLQAEQHARRRHHIWTYTFPLLSFNHPALLQAILALGSLQIAKLQHDQPVASMKHYHLALRRIAKNIGRPGKRAQPSNLAATLLLAYYEVWNSDHVKWSKHLLGARWIMKDIPYPAMTQSMMAIKRRVRQAQQNISRQQPMQNQYQPATVEASGGQEFRQPGGPQNQLDPMYYDWDQINVPLLRAITGRSVTYEQYGMSTEEGYTSPQSRQKFTERDMNQYDQLSDLFWWYCKMDVYQSMLGGTKLFMNYDLWTQCPPRAPIGRLEAIYGTYDHLMLLLGRVTNFSSRDLVRKRRVVRQREAELGSSGAPPGMFAGMVPTSAHIPTPRGFTPPRDMGEDSSPSSDSFEDADLEARTILAHREWAAIKAAFEDFRSNLGPEFDALSPDLSPYVMTPFGPTAHYRTYSIAGIWMNFYMGLIVLYRAHPDMPPWAMMAAGLSARETMRHAIEICRISAGLEPHASQLESLSTLVGAAFIESAFPMFVAGIQLQAQPQRDWLIRRLHDIGRLTGWQSGRAIADGCESAWTKAAAAGKGAPYIRNPSFVADNPAPIWEQSRRLHDRIKEVTHAYGDEHKKVILAREEMPHYALGLLGMQEDLERLDLREQGEQVDA